jgi:spore coat protein U-like protein
MGFDMRDYMKVGLVVLATFAATTDAQAATTATTNFAVTATVLSACTISALPMAFPNYAPSQTTAATAQTTLTVLCTNGTPYNIGLDAGTGAAATIATRKMTSGTNTLNYSLYQNNTYSTVWGNTIGSNTETGTGNGLFQTVNVYGQAAALQTVPAGIYTDSITVTLTY